MFAFRKCVSHIEAAMTSKLSYIFYHHSIIGVLLVLVGIPMVTFAAVCGTTSLILVVIYFLLGGL